MTDNPMNDRTQVLGSDRHLRRDCNDVVSILSCGGEIPTEKVKEILQKAPDLILTAAKRNNFRAYASLMKMLAAIGKLGIETQPKEHSHVHTHTAVVTDEQRGIIEEVQLLRDELARRGLIADERTVEAANVKVHSS